ncbi:4-carboxymuconolactone decarboxylase [Amycolatopsis xylanica]|uniref:4-carboxymuconolactone decarboxylase n=1 Tax=Amycolatopsis xylanica TaxID=589385 RepID=A0A1H3CPS0_9PSEU|nr:carboxymuconolactone decarboxylase family protein [Amycolatopsis xylanica]SDX56030.1 4-carboxymuconolactone decarboxylase [Amycolatopsis xylanica]
MDSFAQGLALIQRLGGAERPAVLDLFESLGEAEFGEACIGFIYGDVYHRPGLELPQRQLATIGALTALGYASAQLQFHAQAALNIGCGRRQIAEAIEIADSIAGTVTPTEFAGAADGDGLTTKEREIMAIAACVAIGTMIPRLRDHLRALLAAGGTRKEAVETLLHLAFYTGFPAALNAMIAARDVLTEKGS